MGRFMKKKIILSLSCAVLQILAIAGTAKADQPYCREYTQTFTIGNTTQKGYGTACLQPDGSWEIQKPASLPSSSRTVVQQQPITYVIKENHTYFVPSRPFRNEIVISGYPSYGHDYYRNHHHRW